MKTFISKTSASSDIYVFSYTDDYYFFGFIEKGQCRLNIDFEEYSVGLVVDERCECNDNSIRVAGNYESKQGNRMGISGFVGKQYPKQTFAIILCRAAEHYRCLPE